MKHSEAIEILCQELGVTDRWPFGPMREETLLIDYLDAMRRGGAVTNVEAKKEFLLTFEEPIYYEENFYDKLAVEESYARVRQFAAMEPVVSVELPSIDEMNLDD